MEKGAFLSIALSPNLTDKLVSIQAEVERIVSTDLTPREH